MRRDADILRGVEEGALPPTLRFFRFKNPTVSFGRLQKPDNIATLAPNGWDIVQRPTGGGIVFHNQDLCLSLIWTRGQSPLPSKVQDVYRWIHAVIQRAFDESIRMASCADACKKVEPFAVRQCFTQPVGYDLLNGDRKIVGGALLCRRNSFLYQGSIQPIPAAGLEERLRDVFEQTLVPLNV
jgi:lipoate-protein ligase A